jgi:LPXTG-site transpeptidase (sortase) family protein
MSTLQKEAPKRYVTKIRQLLQAGVIFVSLLVIILGIGNWMAVRQEIAYTLSAPSTAAAQPSSPAAHLVAPPTPQIISERSASQTPRVLIPAIQVDAPVQLDIPGEDTEHYLSRGVAHLKGSAQFGAVGNVFLTGHSSDYPWRFDPYAAVFALTPHLKAGDPIYLQNNGATFAYVVTSTEVVSPDQLSITNGSMSPVLTIMTCYPIGTTQSRFVVHAALAG